MDKKILLALGAVATSMAISLPAFAHGEFYAGVGANHDSQMDVRVKSGTTNHPFGSEDYDLDDAGLGYSLYGGYNVNHWFAMEVGFDKTGTVTFKAMEGSTDPAENDEYDIEGWRTHLTAVGRLGITENAKATARAGVAYYDIDQKYKDASTPANNVTENAKGFAFTYAAGLEFGMDQWATRLEYSAMLPQNNTEHDDFYFGDIVSVSVQWWFS